MKIRPGQTAFITGGASGIGLGLAFGAGARGMNIMIADVQNDVLQDALAKLRGKGITAEGIVLDVSDRAAVEAAANQTYERFGEVHLVCNNAGVIVTGQIGQIAEGDWKWIVDVNLKGVIYGTETFARHMIRKGVAGHIVNTASAAGVFPYPGYTPYCGTKHAIVGMSEAWRSQLEPHHIRVSILAPGAISTKIFDSRRNRGSAYGGDSTGITGTEAERSQLAQGLDPETLGRYTIDCVETNEPYIFSHVELRPLAEKVFENIMAGFDATRKSKSMAHLSDEKLPSVLSPRTNLG